MPATDATSIVNDKWRGICHTTGQYDILNDDWLVRTVSNHSFYVTNNHVDARFSAEYKHIIEKKNEVGVKQTNGRRLFYPFFLPPVRF